MYDDYDYYGHPPMRTGNAMATAALVLGILSILLSSVIYVALPCGALAIICAILSRSRKKMDGRCKIGIICGVIGMVASLVITVSAAFYLLKTAEGRAYFENFYRAYTGDYDFDLDGTLRELFPFLGDSEDNGSQTEPAAPGQIPDLEDPYADPSWQQPGNSSQEGGYI